MSSVYYDNKQNPASAPPVFIAGQAPPPPSYSQYGQPPPPNREQLLLDLLRRHEISRDFAARLQKHLVMSKIVFVFDDSGSMHATLRDSPLNTGVFQAQRWDELKAFAKIAIDVAHVFNPEGVDVFFLNRPPARSVRNYVDLEPYFQTPPNGFTPIPRTLVDVLRENDRQRLGERKLLIVIVTDGEPTDDYGRKDVQGFKSILQNREQHVYTSIVACTDEDGTMAYLNDWDRRIPRLDVVDDYRSEKAEITRAKGAAFSFSYGDYVVKSMIGSLDPELDNFDEPAQSECCSVL